MKASRPSSRQHSLELRDEMDTRVQQQRQRPLPAWLSTRGNRRSLALAPAVTFTLGVLAAIIGNGTGGLLVMFLVTIGGAAGTVLLRRATQMLDAAPLALLDEREIAERNHGHQRAFQWVLALIGVLWVLAIIDQITASTSQLLGNYGWIYLTLAALVSASMLPAAALAWNWKAPQDLDDLEN